jgi:hypothetical protein
MSPWATDVGDAATAAAEWAGDAVSVTATEVGDAATAAANAVTGVADSVVVQ